MRRARWQTLHSAVVGVLLLAACTEPTSRWSVDSSGNDDADRDPAPAAAVETTAAAATPTASATTPVIGQLVDVRGLPVVRLKGSPREMGLQHGRALAAGIKEGFEEFVLKHRCHGIRARYEQIAKRIDREIEVPDALREELAGMLEGMQASGVDLALPMLRRELQLNDLLVLNTIDHWGLFGCSGFTAWGRSTVGGEVLTSRNFDFDIDPAKKAIARLGVVLAFEPDGDIRFASFTFPGMVGVVTGLNEEGVGAFLHVGNGGFGGGDEGLTLPLTLLARELVQTCAPDAAAPRARELLATARIRNSFLFRVVTPGGDAPPTTVFEVDPTGVDEQRLPDESKGEAPLLLTTNHYLKRPPGFGVIPDSQVRFTNLEESGKSCLIRGDRVIDADEAWQGLELVAQQGNILTLHSIVWRPGTQELWAAFASTTDAGGGRVRAAAASRQAPISLRLGELFGD